MVAILHPTGPGTQIPIDRAVVLVGRSPECDAVLDFSTRISRMHCALVQVDAEYFIRDLGSLNGVCVAGKRIEKDVRLSHGSEVMIGDVKFIFLENVQPTARPGRNTIGTAAPVFIDETIEVLDVKEVEVLNAEAFNSDDAGQPIAVDAEELVYEVEIIEEDVEVVEIVDDVEVVDEHISEKPRRRPRLR